MGFGVFLQNTLIFHKAAALVNHCAIMERRTGEFLTMLAIWQFGMLQIVILLDFSLARSKACMTHTVTTKRNNLPLKGVYE